MKAPQGPAQGSMGIPPNIQAAGERAREEASRRREEQEKPLEPPPATALADATLTDEQVKQAEPMKILEQLGITFTEEMFSALLFKGFVEIPVEIVKGRLTVKFKTLTTEEHDFVDELVAEELKDKNMTNEGFQNRRSLWVLSFGTVEMQGRPVAKLVIKDKALDLLATVKLRREVLGKLAPAVINPMIQKHGAMTVAFNMIVADPGTHIKNS